MSEMEAVTKKLELTRHQVSSMPPSTIYIPDFITPEEEEQLLNKIRTAPLPRWAQLSRRRLQTWPSSLSSSNTLLAAPLPAWLHDPIIPRLESQTGIFMDSPHGAPNHVLINEYAPGQGIMPHEDGAAYHPVVATVSLGAAIVLDIYQKRETGEREIEPTYRILQEPRSLLITTDEMYTKHLHGIQEITADRDLGPKTISNWDLLGHQIAFTDGQNERQVRTSLTYRDVLKVSKLGSKMKIFGNR
ncbi:Alkbh6 protein [Xylona heveae TC161]|uniref:Alkbh6 protein n=1 Tax=Xylona heveae (strain CBS 132557 / TC161) TaxID=1328760 RepID=A0A165GHQ4_XYLHT|nr:Alkbh6 protein [Xylona heveae TC161]KZF22197.1 Alkbh6 protein [Xylona heveae TC161]